MPSVAAEPYLFDLCPALRARDHRHAARLSRTGRLRRRAWQRCRRCCAARSSRPGACWTAARAAGMLVIHTREGHRPDLADLPAGEAGARQPTCGSAIPARWAASWSAASPATTSSPNSHPIAGEPVIDKPGKGAFYATDLEAILRNRGIAQLDRVRRHHRGLRQHHRARGQRPRLRLPRARGLRRLLFPGVP